MPTIKHKMSQTRFYTAWVSMRSRCKYDNKYWKNRGISVCGRWKGEEGFKNFLNDMYADYLDHVIEHGYKDTTLDRIDNDGDYTPNNCRWATHTEQMRNTRRSDLTDEKVEKIRNLYKEKTQQEIADIFNLSQPFISRIINKKRWA